MRYCRSLEESSFRNRTADFFWFVLLAACTMLLVAPFLRFNFLGSSLNYAMVYLWARRNPYARMNMLGIFDFNAPYLPYVLLGFSVLMGANGASDILGIAVGHSCVSFTPSLLFFTCLISDRIFVFVPQCIIF
jgi:Derlin-2/3